MGKEKMATGAAAVVVGLVMVAPATAGGLARQADRRPDEGARFPVNG
jgi:hypothetical protein